MHQDEQRDYAEENYAANHCPECRNSPCNCKDLACDICGQLPGYLYEDGAGCDC